MFAGRPPCVLVLIVLLGCTGDRPAKTPNPESPSAAEASIQSAAAALTQQDKIEAARTIVAWIVEDKTVPGIGQYPDAKLMKNEKNFYLICEFLPQDVILSQDPRVQRVTAEQAKSIFEKQEYQDAVYLRIKISSESDGQLHLVGSNSFGDLGVHGFEITFRKVSEGLRAEGGITWVS